MNVLTRWGPIKETFLPNKAFCAHFQKVDNGDIDRAFSWNRSHNLLHLISLDRQHCNIQCSDSKVRGSCILSSSYFRLDYKINDAQISSIMSIKYLRKEFNTFSAMIFYFFINRTPSFLIQFIISQERRRVWCRPRHV